MKTHIFTPCYLMLFALAGASPLVQAQDIFLAGLNLDYLTYHSGVLVWKAGCLPGVGPASIIERTPSGGGTVATYFEPQSCDGSSVRPGNIAVDPARRAYWATTGGYIVMRDASAVPGTPPVTLAAMANASAIWVAIAVSANYVYWSETFGELELGTLLLCSSGSCAPNILRDDAEPVVEIGLVQSVTLSNPRRWWRTVPAPLPGYHPPPECQLDYACK